MAVRLVPGTDSARDTAYAKTQTGEDGVFVLMAPAPGTYRVRIGDAHVGPALTLASAEAVDEHEYLIRPTAPAPDSSAYHVLHGVELEAALRSGRPLLECEVDKKAAVVPGSLQALYPSDLRYSRGAGSLITQFVIDTTGRLEPPTLRVWRTRDTDEAFVTSARTALVHARYLPALADGRRVRQLATIPMTFTMTGGPAPVTLKTTRCGPIGDDLPAVLVRERPPDR